MAHALANAPDWLTTRPIAHRGLHNRSVGIIENSLSAARAAVEKNFALECDVQLSADGEIFVIHDDTLDRVTDHTGRIDQLPAALLKTITLKGSSDTIPTLDDLLSAIGGQVPLICEIKSQFDTNESLAARVLETSARYDGPLAFKSFDPAKLVALRTLKCTRPLGFIGETTYDSPEWDFLGSQQKRDLIAFAHYADTQPDFLSWWVRDLPNAATNLYRRALNRPIMTWTIRTPEQRATAQRHADQMVFEGFLP